MLKAYEEQIGLVKLQRLSAQLNPDGRQVRSLGIYLCQERYDVGFTVKELASRMSNPTAMCHFITGRNS